MDGYSQDRGPLVLILSNIRVRPRAERALTRRNKRAKAECFEDKSTIIGAHAIATKDSVSAVRTSAVQGGEELSRGALRAGTRGIIVVGSKWFRGSTILGELPEVL